MIRALTGFSTRNPWKVIALWAVVGIFLTLLSQALIYRVTQSQSGDFLPAKYDSAAALKVAEERFGVKPDANAVTVLVARADGKPLTGADERRVTAVAQQLGDKRVEMPEPEDDTPSFMVEDYSQTPKVASAMVAPDRAFQLLTAQLTGNSTDPGMQDLYRAFRDDAKEEFAEVGMRTGFTGGLADLVDTGEEEETTEKIVGAVMMGLIVLINVLVFRSVLAAFVPLPLLAVVIVGGAAAGAVVGAAMLTGIKLDASTPSMISVVLIGIGYRLLPVPAVPLPRTVARPPRPAGPRRGRRRQRPRRHRDQLGGPDHRGRLRDAGCRQLRAVPGARPVHRRRGPGHAAGQPHTDARAARRHRAQDVLAFSRPQARAPGGSGRARR